MKHANRKKCLLFERLADMTNELIPKVEHFGCKYNLYGFCHPKKQQKKNNQLLVRTFAIEGEIGNYLI